MDLSDPNRFRTRKRKPLPSTERLLGVPPHAPSLENRTSSPADELVEDDVVFFYDDSTEPSSSSSPIPTPTPTPNHHNHHRNHRHSPHHKASPFGPPDAFGILAALPENDASPNARNGSPFLHKAPVSVSVSASLSSSSSSSSSRAILAIPRPPSDRNPSSSSFRFHQSAPVKVPAMSPAMLRAARRFDEKEAEAAVEALADEEMRPPHEFVTWKSTMSPSPILAYSVLEGVGRTLKGRDLRQVRNAVLRQTGFIG